MLDWLHWLLLTTTCAALLLGLWWRKQVWDLRNNYAGYRDAYHKAARELHDAQAVIRRTQEHSAQLNMLINKHLNQP